MKKYILLLIGMLSMVFSYGQNNGKPELTKNSKDDFTYKKIEILESEEGNISLTGGEASFGKSLSTSSAKSFAGGGSGIGETTGVLSVSPTGGAKYDIPIAVPTGLNGVTPEIALSYDSQSGNGIAGYGWNISGISTISRLPATKFHDNQIDGVDFNNLDRFALDGQRLVLKSGTYGADGAEYETETYSNLKITSHGTSFYGAASGPEYFLVKYPDGSSAKYGNSHSRPNYSITYWENPQGVRISYWYVSDNNSRTIGTIRYGGLNGIDDVYEIRFSYRTNAKRWEQSYINNVSFARSKILDKIEVFKNTIRYREYDINNFSRTSGLKYERMHWIKEYSGDNTAFHSSIDFDYTSSPSSVNYNGITTGLTLANIEQRNAETLSLDLTGNGKMDFMVYPKTSKDKLWIFKDIQNGANNQAYEVNTGAFEAVFPTTWINYQNKVLAGQGFTVVQNGIDNQIDFKVYSNGIINPIYYQYTKTWNALSYQYDYSDTSSVIKSRPNEYISGDFNGDGLTDVLAIGKSYTTSTCYEYDYTGNPDYYDDLDDYNSYLYLFYDTYRDYYIDVNGLDSYYCTQSTHNNNTAFLIDLKQDITTGFVNYTGGLQQSFGTGDNLSAGDFNGDGKTDLMHVTTGKVYIYTLNDSNNLTLLWQTTDAVINTYPAMLGDYNGDGKTDFLVPTANNSYSFKWFISTGTSFVSETRTQPFQYKVTNWNGNNGVLSGYNLIPLDINGDGKTDIVEYNTTTYNSSSNGTQVINIYNNHGLNGTTASTRVNFVSGGTATKTGDLKHFPIPIYLTSDQPNKNLDFASVSDKWVTHFSFTQDHREDVLIRSITNNGVTQSIDYSNLDSSLYNSDNMQIYQPVYDETYPYVDLQIAPGNKVVSELQRISAGTTTLKQLYTYYGAVYNTEGLGFLGFKGMAGSNWHTDSSDRIFNVSKYDPLLRGAITDNYSLANSFTFTVPSSGYITKTTYQYNSSLAANKVFKLWQTSSTTQNALEGTTTVVSNIYDVYNNPTKISTLFLGYGSHVVDMTYDNNTGATYYIGRPTNRVETKNIAGDIFSIETKFTYTGYLLTQKETKGNAAPFDIETFTYDTYGNITKKTATPNGETAREINYEYDTSGRFLTKITDTEGLETTYLYNVNNRTLTKETNPFGQETNYEYDSWDRLTKVTDYLGNDVTTSYVEAGDHSYTVTHTGDDGSGAITIYDPLKRVTTKKQKDVLGQWVSVSYLYDDQDRLWKQSEPYITSASQWNEIEYDLYSRPIKQTNHTGKVTNISYSGLTVTVNDGTQTKTITKNAMGLTTAATDPGGTINYTYFGNGNLKTANYNGVVVSVEQDEWGRKTKLTDPSAGIYTYAYNGFGEITNETTPKGSTTYTYSAIGKLTQKVITGDNTNMTMQYGYNTTNKLLSSISLVGSNSNNATYTYTYDSFQRLEKTTEINTHAKFTKEFAYDTYGRIDTEEYYAELLMNGRNSLKKIKNTYQNGGLQKINHVGGTNEALWTLNGINARGQITELLNGNGLREFNTYNAYGHLTTSETKVILGPNTIEYMTLTNDFDVQRGLLNSRTNSLFSWSENFTYDSLDRLIDFNDNNGDNNNTYDLLGRITTNSEVGDYSYTGNSYQLDNVDLNNQGDIYFQNKSLQQVTYNAFKKPFEINQDGKEKIGFQYNAFMRRSHMFYGDTNNDILQRNNRKHYSSDGSMEISHDSALNKTTFVTYLNGDGYDATVIWRKEQDLSATSEAFHFLHRDYLGSILMITNRSSQVKEKRHFDAWGNLVKLTDGQGNNLDKFVYLDRGYTGHEHLQGVDLIHMNGRLYDPKLKRFLAPDNYIQDVSNTQNFNRYGYVLNNPLMYVDPSGETYGDPTYQNGGTTASGQQSSFSEGWGFGLLGSAAFSAYNLIKENWGGIDKWTTENIFRPIQDMRFASWVSGWFKKRSKRYAPVEYNNYAGLNSDPLAGASTNIPPSFFGGGGTSTSGLGIINPDGANVAYAYEVGGGAIAPGHSLIIDLETGIGMEIFHPNDENNNTYNGVWDFFNPWKRASIYQTWNVFEPGTLNPYTGVDSFNKGKNFWRNGGIDGQPRGENGLKLDFKQVKNIKALREFHYNNVINNNFYYGLQGVCTTYCQNLLLKGGNFSGLMGGLLPWSGTGVFSDYEIAISPPIFE
ncbi:RHS repeat-associated core domain-containing protein [Flavivirga aquimarina]|uniref:RHS repeat-associated core domain-containing protein n=1 Tax=Flavivirga aquimarina TaxID=2027862 RepID=A0ABT8W4Z6_9FLAO|nr:RHS repeat-associated core domain-containing protein [Flavivirga aquimarina]MDO5968192.1 RHS repeat-associated core domain-containing protein [Flavivirga aquimarina]